MLFAVVANGESASRFLLFYSIPYLTAKYCTYITSRKQDFLSFFLLLLLPPTKTRSISSHPERPSFHSSKQRESPLPSLLPPNSAKIETGPQGRRRYTTKQKRKKAKLYSI